VICSFVTRNSDSNKSTRIKRMSLSVGLLRQASLQLHWIARLLPLSGCPVSIKAYLNSSFLGVRRERPSRLVLFQKRMDDLRPQPIRDDELK
jgi:hypothetical protein